MLQSWLQRIAAGAALAAALIAGGAVASTEQSLPYDFKSIRLGISVEEFRVMAHPDGRPITRVACTGDRDKYGPLSAVSVYGVEGGVGVVKCVFRGPMFSVPSIEETSGLNMGGGSYASFDYEIKFVADPVDGKLRLYEIVAPTNVAALDDILTALTQKFGSPKATVGEMKTRSGASFDQQTFAWDNGVSTAVLQTRWSKVDDLVVIYTHKRLAAVVEKAKDDAKAAIPNRI